MRVIPIRLSVKDLHEPYCGLGGLWAAYTFVDDVQLLPQKLKNFYVIWYSNKKRCSVDYLQYKVEWCLYIRPSEA